eukprot:12780745-Alexandrium_andersonii.AAC.1
MRLRSQPAHGVRHPHPGRGVRGSRGLLQSWIWSPKAPLRSVVPPAFSAKASGPPASADYRPLTRKFRPVG